MPGTRKEVQFYSNRQKSKSSLGHRNDLSLLEVEAFFWTTERRQSNPKAYLLECEILSVRSGQGTLDIRLIANTLQASPAGPAYRLALL